MNDFEEILSVEIEKMNWQGIDPSHYAVAAFFDLKRYSGLDKDRLGISTEQYGFSNNVHGKFGPPK